MGGAAGRERELEEGQLAASFYVGLGQRGICRQHTWRSQPERVSGAHHVPHRYRRRLHRRQLCSGSSALEGRVTRGKGGRLGRERAEPGPTRGESGGFAALGDAVFTGPGRVWVSSSGARGRSADCSEDVYVSSYPLITFRPPWREEGVAQKRVQGDPRGPGGSSSDAESAPQARPGVESQLTAEISSGSG